MARHLQSDCDNCGTLLRGMNGREFVERDYLSLRGALVCQFKDEDGQPDHAFVTRRRDEEMHFCDAKCLTEFIDYRKQEYLDRQNQTNRLQFQRETNN